MKFGFNLDKFNKKINPQKTDEEKNWEEVGINQENYKKYRKEITEALLYYREAAKEDSDLMHVKKETVRKMLEFYRNTDNYKLANSLHDREREEIRIQIKEPRVEQKDGKFFRVTRILMPKELQEYKHGNKEEYNKEDKEKIEEKWHLFINKITNGAYFDYKNLNHTIRIDPKRKKREDFYPTDEIDPFKLSFYNGMFFATGPNKNPEVLDFKNTIMVFTLENKNFYNFIVSIMKDKMKKGFDKDRKIINKEKYRSERIREDSDRNYYAQDKNLPAPPIGTFLSFTEFNQEFLSLFLLNQVPMATLGFTGGALIAREYFDGEFLENNDLGTKKDEQWSSDFRLKWIDLARYIYDPIKGELYEPVEEDLITLPEDPDVKEFEDLKWDFEKK